MNTITNHLVSEQLQLTQVKLKARVTERKPCEKIRETSRDNF